MAQNLRSLLRQGRVNQVLTALDAGRGASDQVRRGVLRFDASWLLGDLDGSGQTLESLMEFHPTDARVLLRSDRMFDQTREIRWAVSEPEPPSAEDPGSVTQYVEFLMQRGRLTQTKDFLDELDARDRLNPPLRLRRARLTYLAGDLRGSRAEAARLRESSVGLGAQRLLRTLDFEESNFARVLDTDLPPLTDFDHLRYHALLATGRLAEAFAMRPFLGDLAALRSEFSLSARDVADPAAGSIGVVSESGPGDQIHDLAVVEPLLERISTMVFTIDPRLEPLVSRSLPGVSYVPSNRIFLDSFGAFAAGHDRLVGQLALLLTQRAGDRLRQCDQVSLARSLVRMGDQLPAVRRRRLLKPRTDLIEALRTTSEGRIGICWRSEKQTPWRSVHYLEAQDLAPLNELPADFVCLQHDVRREERLALEASLPGRVEYVDEIDLRNDFESTAALVAGLRGVVGVGTTMTVLSAAVGTPTWVLLPSNFGRWLADREQDPWLPSRRYLSLVDLGGSRGLRRAVQQLARQI